MLPISFSSCCFKTLCEFKWVVLWCLPSGFVWGLPHGGLLTRAKKRENQRNDDLEELYASITRPEQRIGVFSHRDESKITKEEKAAILMIDVESSSSLVNERIEFTAEMRSLFGKIVDVSLQRQRTLSLNCELFKGNS
jgi:hypothetical protein